MSDEQARMQLLSCLKDVKLDLEALKQHSSAVVVGQAIEMIEGYALRLGSEVRNAYKTGYFDAIAEWAPQMAGSEAMRQHMQIRLAEHVAYVSSGAGDATSSTAEHVGYLSWPSKCTPWCPACAIDGEDQEPKYLCDCGETFRSHLERVAHMANCYTQLGNPPES